jgi:hypothetical protein
MLRPQRTEREGREIWLSQLKLLQPGKAMSYKLWLGAISLALTRHPSAPGRKNELCSINTVTGNRCRKRRITTDNTTKKERRG